MSVSVQLTLSEIISIKLEENTVYDMIATLGWMTVKQQSISMSIILEFEYKMSRTATLHYLPKEWLKAKCFGDELRSDFADFNVGSLA